MLSFADNRFRGYRLMDRPMATGVRDSRASAGLSPAVVRSHRDRHGDDARDQWPTGAGTSGTQALPWPYQALAADELSRVAVGAGDTDWAPLLAGHGLRLARADVRKHPRRKSSRPLPAAWSWRARAGKRRAVRVVRCRLAVEIAAPLGRTGAVHRQMTGVGKHGSLEVPLRITALE